MDGFLGILHSLRSPAALEKPRKSSRSFLGVIVLGLVKNRIRSCVISSLGECGKVFSCEVLCCS